MQKVRIDSSPTPPDPPPIPYTCWEKPVYITAIPIGSNLRYIFNLVMSGMRGSIGWDSKEETMVLYFEVESQDHLIQPGLEVGGEIWAVFSVRGVE